MKQFNRIILGVIVFWLLAAGVTVFLFNGSAGENRNKGYLVEINRLEDQFVKQKGYSPTDLSGNHYIKQVDYYPVTLMSYAILFNPEKNSDSGENKAGADWKPNATYTAIPYVSSNMNDYFMGKGVIPYNIKAVPGGCEYLIKPFDIEQHLLGYLRYDYVTDDKSGQLLLFIEAIQLILFIIILALLFYIKQNVIKPFHEISELPYELSKGHLSCGLKESKNRYFGKFLWGLDLLRESLEEHKRKELKLEKDKKLMLLSISHDIKTPLSTIKLYSKALYGDLYESSEKRHSAAKLIEEKADQIENFVAEIIKTSSTELFEFDIKQDDFYLSSIISVIERTYGEKFDLLKINFEIKPYIDKMLSGDPDKLMEVFENLLQNAIKYGDGKKITMSFAEEDNCQLIRITNTGEPVPSTDFVHMFESFWRGTNALEKQGNGLGLYICKQMMQKMGGEIFAESGENEMSLVVVIRKS